MLFIDKSELVIRAVQTQQKLAKYINAVAHDYKISRDKASALVDDAATR